MSPSTPARTKDIPVIIVGGSLVGLSTALCLAYHHVPTIVLERHPGSSAHPRALGYTSRTMEIYHALGIDDEQIFEVPADFKLTRARVESLAGKWFEESAWTEKQEQEQKEKGKEDEDEKEGKSTGSTFRDFSFSLGAAIAQDKLEAILREAAIRRGVDLRYRNTLVSFEQDGDGDGVTALVKDESDDHEYTLRTSYLIAADGHHSPIREKLGIQRHGRGHMQTARSVLFRAPLDEYLTGGVVQFNIDQPDLKAFLTHYNDGRWVLMFFDDTERDEDTLKTLIYKAIGRDDLPVEIITTGRWELTALVAEKFQSGRVFLAGDAAHTLPPNRGGYGANTGIADGHNLAWKVASVLSGVSKPELLDTYDVERRPVALLRHQQIFARADYKVHLEVGKTADEVIDDAAMEFGQLYRSKSFLGVRDDLPPALRPDQWAGQPGTRAAHFWLSKGEKKMSSLDLFQHGWVLLTESAEWRDATKKASAELSVKVEPVQVGVDVQMDDIEVVRKAMGISNTGASLIRPDGFIAWRSNGLPSDAAAMLKDVLCRVAFAQD